MRDVTTQPARPEVVRDCAQSGSSGVLSLGPELLAEVPMG